MFGQKEVYGDVSLVGKKVEGLTTKAELQDVRDRLSGQKEYNEKVKREQAWLEKKARIESEFGLLYTAKQIHNAVTRVFPVRKDMRLRIQWSPVEKYSKGPIPDTAIERWLEAKKSGLFNGIVYINEEIRSFAIVYGEYEHVTATLRDPWLLGITQSLTNGVECVVLAYWD